MGANTLRTRTLWAGGALASLLLARPAINNLALLRLEQGTMRGASRDPAACAGPAAGQAGPALRAVLLAAQAEQQGCADEALAWWESALAEDAGNSSAAYALGRAYEARGEWERALTYYRRVPLSAYERLARGQHAWAGQDRAAAYAEYQAAEQIAPDLPEPHYYLGEALAYYVGDLNAALAEYNTAVRLGYPDSFVWTRIAHMEAMAGRLEVAVAVLDSNHQDNPLANAIRGQTYRAAGQPGPALEYYQRAVTQGPNDPWLYFGLGRAYQDLSRLPEAITAWKQALAVSPGFSPAREALCEVKACPESIP